MAEQSVRTNQYNRREFVVAASAVVVGGLGACSGYSSAVQSGVAPKNHVLAIPTKPISMRVRVARSRKSGENWLLNGVPVSTNTEGLLYTPLKETQIVLLENDVFCLKKQTPHVIGQGEKLKTITGDIYVHPRKDISRHAFDIVAHVPLENYLPGVLAGELYAHWHPATFASQAVAARSYAVVQHLNRKNTSHYDLDDGPSSQMFLGDVTLDVAHRAVAESDGVVLSWEDTVVPAYYCSCCGGFAATAKDGISSSSQHNIAPLEGRSGRDICVSLDIHKWDASRSLRTFRRRLNASSTKLNTPELASIRSIKAIEPTSTNRHGRPTLIKIVDRRNKSVEIHARQFVRAANASVSSLPPATPTIWSSFVSGEKNGAAIKFNGVGMGHGVGLCQYGAQALAGEGRGFEEILSWYYPQVSFSTLQSS